MCIRDSRKGDVVNAQRNGTLSTGTYDVWAIDTQSGRRLQGSITVQLSSDDSTAKVACSAMLDGCNTL